MVVLTLLGSTCGYERSPQNIVAPRFLWLRDADCYSRRTKFVDALSSPTIKTLAPSLTCPLTQIWAKDASINPHQSTDYWFKEQERPDKFQTGLGPKAAVHNCVLLVQKRPNLLRGVEQDKKTSFTPQGPHARPAANQMPALPLEDI